MAEPSLYDRLGGIFVACCAMPALADDSSAVPVSEWVGGRSFYPPAGAPE
jgi:hypothetical protein